MTSPRASVDRVLGALGVVGGAGLLAAFVVEVPSNVAVLRLVLYFVGSIAVVIGLARRQGWRDGRMAIVAGVAVALDVWSMSMVLLSIGRDHQFGGDFGRLWFWIALATWLADAAVGLLAWRRRTTLTIGALALAIGSALAILGMDRVGLSSAADITVFGRLGLLGVALNGFGWVLVGLDLVGRRPTGAAIEASPA